MVTLNLVVWLKLSDFIAENMKSSTSNHTPEKSLTIRSSEGQKYSFVESEKNNAIFSSDVDELASSQLTFNSIRSDSSHFCVI